MPRRIKLTVEYDGTDFNGWQVQSTAEEAAPDRNAPDDDAVRTIQGTIERGLTRIAKQPIRIAGASRTDRGVHAMGQVASFILPDDVLVETADLCMAMNSNVPKDISARKAEEVDLDFHPQRDAIGKIYTYSMVCRRERPSILRRTHWHVRFPMQIEPMREAAKALIGQHDFTSFATRLRETQELRAAEGKRPLSTVREIRRIEIRESTVCAGAFEIDVEGSGFLYQQVRTIAGSLVDVGRGYRKPEWMAEALAAKDRRCAGPTAPPHGLCLMKVLYS